MNREIKFRAWDKELNKEASGNIVSTIEKAVACAEQNNIVLRQFTGLKDKNGVEIYEGDVVKVNKDYTHPDKRIIEIGNYEIRYMMSSFGIHRRIGWWELADFGVEVAPEYGRISNIEVIGNIYENEELSTK